MTALRYPPVAPGVGGVAARLAVTPHRRPRATTAESESARLAARWPWSLADALPALGRELAGQGARFAAIQLDGQAGCVVSAIRARPPVPSQWTIRLDGEALADLVRRQRAERAPADAATEPTDDDASAERAMLLALRHAGRCLDGQRPSRVLVLASVEDGAVSVTGPDGEPIPTERPRRERQVFHPGQQARYQSPRQEQPVEVTVRRLGRRQIQVTFPDGRDAAIHRKWLTPLDWTTPPTADGPLTVGA